jgi:hypothetical protein
LSSEDFRASVLRAKLKAQTANVQDEADGSILGRRSGAFRKSRLGILGTGLVSFLGAGYLSGDAVLGAPKQSLGRHALHSDKPAAPQAPAARRVDGKGDLASGE